jgi:MerR family transcriptional regulator, redox-sensitive transcriptional activator SoxR
VDPFLSIGAVSERTGVATSALRFYESEQLIHADRTPSGQRRYPRDTLRRVAFIRAAQQLGLTLQEIHQSLATLPNGRTPDEHDWERLSRAWRPRLDEQIAVLERLRDRLDQCIGCGCLSLRVCHMFNPEDRAAAGGCGPRYVLDGPPAEQPKGRTRPE